MNPITAAPFVAAVTGVVGHTHAHESAALHVAGTATYIDDLPELAGTLHAALGLSPLARPRAASPSTSCARCPAWWT